jgi:hypothetical protein
VTVAKGNSGSIGLPPRRHAALKLAEAAHHLVPGLLKYPHRNDVGELSTQDRAALRRAGATLRDFAIGVSEAIKALSPATLNQIAQNSESFARRNSPGKSATP